VTAIEEMSDTQKTFLEKAAARYIWWKTPNEILAYPQKIFAQVMNIGVWDDIYKLVELFPREDLLDVLNSADIGQFNERSWHFWHNRSADKIPPMPGYLFSRRGFAKTLSLGQKYFAAV
jgi:hypothetical protein